LVFIGLLSHVGSEPEELGVLMKASYTSLQELIAEMQSRQANQEEEMGRLRRRQAWLETRRREFFDVVTVNSSDFEMRRRLEETEQQLEEIHGQIARAESELKVALQGLRQRMIDLRNEELTRLEQESKAMRQRKTEIHNELLPEALGRVTALREEEDRLNQRSEEINRRIRELNQLDLPTTQVA
jgi:chromosome segregation ATPase